MTYCIPSDVARVDTDGNGKIDRLCWGCGRTNLAVRYWRSKQGWNFEYRQDSKNHIQLECGTAISGEYSILRMLPLEKIIKL
jgi:hypothetical protein